MRRPGTLSIRKASPFKHRLRIAGGLGVLSVAAFLFSGPAFAQPSFSKNFDPSTIGPGSVSTLEFTITNGDESPADSLAFSDTLPAGVTIASPANAVSGCGGILSTPGGGTTVSLSGGQVGGSASCTVSVDVTAAVPGIYTNVSGDLTSSLGNSGTAEADLVVAGDRPGFRKSFDPSGVGLGERSTLTFTIDNSLNTNTAFNLTFTDNLPTGLVVANPAIASTTCSGGVITASPGGTVVSYAPAFFGFGDASVAAGASCTVSVDVVAAATGVLINTSGELTSSPTSSSFDPVSSGKASATLDVDVEIIHLTKSFTDDPVEPGGTVTLEFTVDNRDRNLSATDIAFTDDLDATLSGLAAIGLPATDVCGVGSQLTETGGVLELSGGNLGSGGSCTFSVVLQVPAGAVPGAYPNATSTLSAELGGSPFIGELAASDTLFVDTAPRLTKAFLSNPVGTGNTVTVEFEITNTSPTFAASDIAFDDNLSAFISGVTVASLPADGFCGAGASLSTAEIVGQLHLVMSGGELAAGASCTFTVDLDIPATAPDGTFTNTTGNITATIDGSTRIGKPATATLTVFSELDFRKEFTDDPVQPGDTVTLQFTISLGEETAGDTTNIAFTDDLNVTLAGLAAAAGQLPMNDVCGAGSLLSGDPDDSTLSLTGGNLAIDESCSFSIVLQVPAGALPGNYPNTTSDITATVDGVNVSDVGASDVLQISGLEFVKSFTDDPVIPGGTVDLEFTVTNTSTALDATAIQFSDDLGNVLPGLVPAGSEVFPQADLCGAGSELALGGTDFLSFTGGNLLAGTSCSFTVTLQVPAGAASDTYPNTTSNLVADMGSTVVVDPATDLLVVTADILALSKVFTDDAVAPGDIVGLEFTVTNLSLTETVTDITFTDNLPGGLTAVGLPVNDVCGAGSQVSGTDLITLTGGSLTPGASCIFSVDVQAPAGGELGTVLENTTSEVTGLVGILPVRGDPASDTIRLRAITFTKVFASDVLPGDTTTLTFTIENFDSERVERLGFTDDLDAALPGLVATGLPLSDICGAGSSITGTDLLAFTGGNLGSSGVCTFDVSVLVPAGAVSGDYTNTTSDLTADEAVVADPATATLTVLDPVDDRVTICHKPGTPAEKTLRLPQSAVPGHLGHGDTLGACGSAGATDAAHSAAATTSGAANRAYLPPSGHQSPNNQGSTQLDGSAPLRTS